MSVDVGSAKGYLDLDISGFLKGLKTAQAEADSASKNIATKIGDGVSKAGKSLTSAGTTLTKTVTLPVTAAGTAVIKLSADFESAMSKVSAISGATGEDFDRLNAKAQEMGAKTKFSATESAEAFTYMAMAGWKTEDMLQGIEGIMSLAAADGLDLATTSDIVTDALTAFGLSAADSGHFADVLAKASSAANTNVSMLGESFKYVAPVAGALGYTAEDVAVALGLMANSGIKGSQGGTALRASITRLIKPSEDAAAMMEKYNLSLTNSDGSMKSLSEVMAMLRTNLGELTEAEQAEAAAQIFGQEAMSGMLSIINATEKDYDGLINQIYNADGAAQQMADTMLNNLSGQLTILKSALEGLALQFGEILLPYIKQFTGWIQNLVQRLQELTPEQKEQIVKWAAIAAAIGPVLVIAGKLTSGIGKLITTFGKVPGVITKFAGGLAKLTGATLPASGGVATLGTSIKALGASIAGVAAPILAIVAVIAALVAAFTSLWKTNEEFRNKMIAIWNEIKASFEKLTSGIVERLNKLGFDFKNISEVLSAIWKGFCDLLAPYFEGVFQYIADTFNMIVNVILGIVDFFIAIFTGNWQGAWDAVKGIFESVWNGIVSWFENITNVLIGTAQTILGWFGVEWNAAIEGVGNTFKNIWQSVSDFFTGIVEYIWSKIGPLFEEIAGAFQMAWDVIKLIWDYVQPYFAAIWEGIKAVFSIVGEWFKLIFGIAWENIKAVWSVVVAWFTLIWENIKAVFSVVGAILSGFFKVAWEAIKAIWNVAISFFTMIWAGIKAVFAVVKGVLSGNFSDAWEAIKNVWNKAVDFFKSIWNGIKNIFGAVVSFFTNTFSSAWQAIKNVFSNFGSFFSSLWNTIKNTFVNLGTKIGNAISNSVKAGINGVIGMIENKVNGFIGLINGAINLINAIPGVEISKLSKLSFPRLATGGVVTRPTFAQIGEDGAEAVVPLEKNLGWMKNLVKEFMNRFDEFLNKKIKLAECLNDIKETCHSMLEISKQFIDGNMGYIPYGGFGKSDNVNKDDNFSPRENGGGDSFYFYSPKPIDEIEAAKQMKKAKRDLAEGF